MIAELKALPPVTVEALTDAYRAGASINELAARYGVHRTTVAAQLDRDNVPRRQRGLTPDQARDAARLYRSGQSLARIADRHDVDPHTIRTTLLRHGVAKRDAHGRNRSKARCARSGQDSGTNAERLAPSPPLAEMRRAEAVPHRSSCDWKLRTGFQHLLSRAVWDPDAVLATVARWIRDRLTGPAILAVDETGDAKSSTDAVGAARQYSGALGGVGCARWPLPKRRAQLYPRLIPVDSAGFRSGELCSSSCRPVGGGSGHRRIERRSSHQGIVVGVFEVALAEARAGDLNSARARLEAVCDDPQADPRALGMLGTMTLAGHGGSADPVAAAELLERAARGGNGTAAFNLGALYAAGKGVPEDLATAFAWTLRGAELGDRRAMERVAFQYATGQNVPVDLDQAERWLRAAIEQGSVDAMHHLGVLHERGRDDAVTGWEWFLRAAEAGHPQAMLTVAGMYRDGRGCTADPAQALHWFMAPLRHGNGDGVHEALTLVGEMMPQEVRAAVPEYAESLLGSARLGG